MDEATRVLRATHAFGVLGDVVVRAPPSDTRVGRLYEEALVRLQGPRTSACSSASDIAVATRRLHNAYTMLRPYAARLRFHKQVRDALRPITSTLRCPTLTSGPSGRFRPSIPHR